MARSRNLDDLLRDVAGGLIHPVYLVRGDLVVAEPQAARLAAALAEKSGCEVERTRRPTSLAPILANLKTYSLFDAAKVALVVDSAILADKRSAAELIDQAAEALPLAGGGELDSAGREAASRLLQAFHVFQVDPARGEDALDALPKWAYQGGGRYRKKKPRGRPAKDVRTLRKDLAGLLAAALEAGLHGFAEGDLAELGQIVSGGLPPGHVLVLVEPSVAADHPVVGALDGLGASMVFGKVEAGRGGRWQGLEPLVKELAKECGAKIAPDATAELAQRTLRQSGDFSNRRTDAESTARFASEFRKLAGLAQDGRITRQMVEQTVEDRGDQDVWQILDAVGGGQGAEALARLRRYLTSADDSVRARLSFFGILVRFCRQLVAVAGLVKLHEIPWGERNYNRFKDRLAPLFQGEMPHGGPSPLAGTHPFQIYRAYQTAAAMPPDAIAKLPWWMLETELMLKGDSTDADAALSQLVARLVQLARR